MPKTGSENRKDQASKAEGAHFENDIFNRGLDFLVKFRRFGRDIVGVLLIMFALVTLLAFIGLTSGVWVTPWADSLRRWFGLGGILIVIACGVAGLLLMQRQREDFNAHDWGRVVWLELAAFSIVALLSVFGGHSIERAEQGLDGGVIGWGIAEFFSVLLQRLPEGLAQGIQILILFLIAILGIMFGFELFGLVIEKLERTVSRFGELENYEHEVYSPVVVADELGKVEEVVKPKAKQKKVHIPPEFRKDFKLDSSPKPEVVNLPPRDDRLPPIEILKSGTNLKPNERHINQTAGLIEKTLSEFGIPVKVVGFKVGPTITQFALEPGYVDKTGTAEEEERKQKIRVSQISALRRDLALALSAERLRIQAPVPGRPYVGIEVPNKNSVVVRLRSILESEEFYKVNSSLGIALGQDVSGYPIVADLGRMPHLLVAGTTGSGKSVCIAAITACLVMNNSPEDLRIVMIDPKMVELVRFNGLPHLIGKVETDLETINAVLRWVVMEMERRYKLLEELRSRDIESYNRKVRRRKDYEPLPKIVVMIDELADLMMSSAEDTETKIVRLAQMARAVGIHMVIATQRPSTDVVTGLIKANFPARISFAVASGVDSRVILDTVGAESLLGRGDMLFLNPEAAVPVRSQGVMVTDQEIEKIVSYWQDNWVSEEIEDAPWDVMMEKEAVLADRDDLVSDAIEIIKESRSASTSMLQRRLRVGYPRAARLMDELEDLGVVGPSQGGGRERDILIDFDDEEYE